MNHMLLVADSNSESQGVYLMDSPVSAASIPGPHMKCLCSFLGSIMPRPQDGKLRYVGGETRIVTLPRDISYLELIQRMRELYQEAAVLKYQQPDEDLDALVSVVNDDDVTNMMEEYDKLGSGDGFTRLRIFLFSHPDHDGSSPYVDVDDTERRYVDALNNMNDASDLMKLAHPEFPGIGPMDDLHGTEQFANMHIHPHMGTSQLQQLVPERYGEMEAPWNPACYSPRHHGHLDPRPLPDFPSSPSARFHIPFSELQDKMPEEYARQQVSHQAVPTYEHQPHSPDNVVWLPPGPSIGDKSGFPGNILHNSSAFEGNNICDQCRVSNPRNRSHLEQPNIVNGLPQFGNACNKCSPHREIFMPNTGATMHLDIYPKEQSDPQSVYSETHNHEKAWLLQHQLNPRVEESRLHVSGAGRLNDHYIVGSPGMNFPPGHGNITDAHQVPSNYVHHQVPHDQVMAAAPPLHIPPAERGVRYGNVPYAYGTENLYPASYGHVPWRNVQSQVHNSPFYGTSPAAQQLNGTGSPRFFIGGDSQNTWIEPSEKVKGVDVATTAEYSCSKLNPNTLTHENKNPFSLVPVQPQHDMKNIAPTTAPVQLPDSSTPTTHDKLVSASTLGHHLESVNCCTNATEAARTEAKNNNGGQIEKNIEDNVQISCLQIIPYPDNKIIITDKKGVVSFGSISSSRSTERKSNMVKPAEEDLHAAMNNSKQTVYDLIPEQNASMRKVALEESEELKANGEGTTNSVPKETANESESTTANGDYNMGSENDHLNTSKIEPTKAEEEAIARGLQKIKNDDLEEIRELGTGTYGAVYHGKWRGSDVAVKRIKASCFAGRASDRERLIADFWKEALMLSSLHHPNVVSFYGIVRDGPDGSLATVTEFMVNGSLKQFLQKKDRTIDRRKRLIIAMDAAFGMEYLHGKNIVHFDLKCENLLVNMRDPQRPVCKIGDLGLSKVKQKTLVSGGVRGTLPWMAPELLSGKSSMVTEKIDVYSFGIVMWELLTGNEPYADMHCASIIGGIVNNTLRPQIPTWCDPDWKTLMQRCWASDPAERPSFSEVSQKLRTMAAAINVK